MCGIVGQFNCGPKSAIDIRRAVKLLRHRGPDSEGIFSNDTVIFGHTRLSIIDLSERGNQPFTFGSVTISFNGEIWNYRELKTELQQAGVIFNTDSDTEVVAAIIDKFGAKGIERLGGMFAVAWCVAGEDGFYLARDIFGEIPLHFIPKYPFQFCSELKVLKQIGAPIALSMNAPPGSILKITAKGYSAAPFYEVPITKSSLNVDASSKKVRTFLEKSVLERTISDVPVCTLLSGGIDSSIITYLLSLTTPDITAYTAVYNEKSNDLKYARKLADTLSIKLVEVKIPRPIRGDLSKIIDIIEMPYKAQIEIGWICYWLAKKISEDGFKVVFSGEGADELLASYAFSYHQLKKQDFHQYRKELFSSQEKKNFPRTNKIFMHFGVESRLPFLNKNLVRFLLSLPVEIIRDGKNLKNILSAAFSLSIIDKEILYRPKVAFQDGAGIKEDIQKIFGGKQQAMAFYRNEFKNKYLAPAGGFGL